MLNKNCKKITLNAGTINIYIYIDLVKEQSVLLGIVKIVAVVRSNGEKISASIKMKDPGIQTIPDNAHNARTMTLPRKVCMPSGFLLWYVRITW